jgi:hypothetical protein
LPLSAVIYIVLEDLGRESYEKESSRKGVAGFTYKSLVGAIFENRGLRLERKPNGESQ